MGRKRNQIYGRLFTLASLPLSYISLLIVPNPILAVAICAFMQYLYCFYCIYDIKRQLQLELRSYMKLVILPSCMMFFVLIIVGYIIDIILVPVTLINILFNSFVLVVVGILTAFMLMTNGERLFVKNFVAKIYKR